LFAETGQNDENPALVAVLLSAAAQKGRAHVVGFVAERFASVIGGFRTKERRRVLRSLCNAPDIGCAAELLKYTGSGRRVILQDLLLVGAEQARPDVLRLVRSFELRFSNALLVQSVQASIHQLKVLDGQLKVDRAATPLAVCIAWIANACAYLGLADLLAAILRSPLLARHFATASDDAALVALALFSQRNVDDEKCLDEAAKWFVGLPHDRLHPRQLLVVADSAIASKRHSFLRAVLASRLQQTLAPSLSECAMRCAIDRNAIAMDIVLGQNAGATMDQRCFEALSRSCSIGDLATASLLLRRRALPSHVAIETLLISALMRVDLQLDVVELLIAHGADVFATPRGAAASAFGMIRRRQIGHPKCAAFIRRLVLEAQVVPLLVGSTRPERNEPLSLGERAAAYLWRVKRPVDLGANMRSRFYDPAIWRVVARFFCEL
jgi:hypothetical protein